MEVIDIFRALKFLILIWNYINLGEDIARDFFFFFCGMRFFGVTLALVSPINPKLVSTVASDKTDNSVWILSITITLGPGTSD